MIDAFNLEHYLVFFVLQNFDFHISTEHRLYLKTFCYQKNFVLSTTNHFFTCQKSKISKHAQKHVLVSLVRSVFDKSKTSDIHPTYFPSVKFKSCLDGKLKVKKMGDLGIVLVGKPLQKGFSLTFMERVHNRSYFKCFFKENSIYMLYLCTKGWVLYYHLCLDLFKMSYVFAYEICLS